MYVRCLIEYADDKTTKEVEKEIFTEEFYNELNKESE